MEKRLHIASIPCVVIKPKLSTLFAPLLSARNVAASAGRLSVIRYLGLSALLEEKSTNNGIGKVLRVRLGVTLAGSSPAASTKIIDD